MRNINLWLSGLGCVLALAVGASCALGEDTSSLSKNAPGYSNAPGAKFAPQTPAQRRALRIAQKLVNARLRKTKILGQGIKRKAPEDQFLVGTAELSLQTRAADVRFALVEGTEKSSNYLTEYLLTSPGGTARDFQVFARFKNEEDAEKGLLEIRQRYDDFQAYRKRLMDLYNASRIRRC